MSAPTGPMDEMREAALLALKKAEPNRAAALAIHPIQHLAWQKGYFRKRIFKARLAAAVQQAGVIRLLQSLNWLR